MKILLVNPPRSPHNSILEHAPREAKPFIHRKLVGPPLGLLTIAAAVRDGHDVKILDMKEEYDLDPQAPATARLADEWLNRFRPDVVGITFIASELAAGMEIFEDVKRLDPGILTVAGGLHATLCPHDFGRGPVDVVCMGQATKTFRAVVEAKERGESFEHIGGILAREGGGLRPTSAPGEECDPAGRDFVMPMRSLLKRWISTYTVGKSYGPATYVFTSLGCPHRCSFCSIWPQFGGRFMQRDVESIVAELGTLDEYPVVRFSYLRYES